MRSIIAFTRAALALLCSLIFSSHLLAHNGVIAHAYPLGKIVVDGDFSDWPKNAAKYQIAQFISESKATDESDFSGFFQVGYRVDNHSLYIAFTITDNDFIEDTTANVAWNTQDALELSIDARHIPNGSGVASFMYSKKLRNTNNARFDPFASNASWKIMEVVMVRKGNQRFYEWRIQLDDQLVVGKTVGFDFLAFDKDNDGSFTYAGWGKGERKYMNPNSLGDIVLMPSNGKLGTISGSIAWDREMKEKLPEQVKLTSTKNSAMWVQAAVDSTGKYAALVPVGEYKVEFAQEYFLRGDNLYKTATEKSNLVVAKAGSTIEVQRMTVSGNVAPDLLPAKGVLQDFNPQTAAQIDNFIQTYQKYFGIPGVSLALIKDGKMVYHKTYGVRNSMTKVPVDENTLFEAASITKPVFALAVEKLADRGVIDLDKPLYEYLPYPDIANDERYKLITARHVLTHRTGFPNWRSMNPDGKLDIKFTPGTDYNYSGEGFEYLKMVIQKITGKKVEEVLQEEVIKPVGLWHTFFSRNDSLRAMVAEGHFDMLPNYDDLPESPGMAWSMHTEAIIFTKFMLYLAEQKGLSERMYSDILSKHSEYKFGPNEKSKIPTYMGMSLEIRETPYGKSFGHGGNNGDFKCLFEMYKDLKMGYVVFTNSNTSDALLHVLRQFFVEGKEAP